MQEIRLLSRPVSHLQSLLGWSKSSSGKMANLVFEERQLSQERRSCFFSRLNVSLLVSIFETTPKGALDVFNSRLVSQCTAVEIGDVRSVKM